MAVDTPAKIAILGAGPIGLEAALYARFLGYDVAIYEQGADIAAAVQAWGHVKMFTPFGMNRSPLGLAALAAQDEAYRPPGDDELLTGRQWRDRYLVPLSKTDLLADHLRLGQRVLRIGKEQLHKGELVGDAERGDWPFRLLILDRQGVERIDHADVVIDASGVFFGPTAWFGEGGIPALGEMERMASGAIEHALPDLSGEDRQRYAGQHTLVIGAGYSAATNIVALAQLAREVPGTRVTWVTRGPPFCEQDSSVRGPIRIIPGDRLPQRDALAREANALSKDPACDVTHLPETVVHAVSKCSDDGPFHVRLIGRHCDTLSCDQIIANVGFRPDRAVYEELLIHECYASHGPMKLAAAMLSAASADCLDQKACGPLTLLNPEPNFYILGAKSYGRKSNFLLATGLAQIREIFTVIGDRPTLDLYSTPPRRA
ncbi:MAG TPA: hypothetical protein VFB96_14540 [Pirellulaceae bacterium]|nr:hypothetical protein [Pirellulaceae bacterium]